MLFFKQVEALIRTKFKNIYKNAVQDKDGIDGLLIYYNEIEVEQIKAMDVLINKLAVIPDRVMGIHEAQVKCVDACLAYKTDTCNNLPFIKENQKKAME